MKKKFLLRVVCIVSSVVVAGSLVFQTVSADDIGDVFKDNLQINTVPAPTISGNGEILENEPVTEFNDDYYNEHVDDLEDEEVFDEKQDYSSAPDVDNSDNSASTEENGISSYSLDDDTKNYDNEIAVASDDGIEAYSADISSYVFPNGWNGDYGEQSFTNIFNVTVNDFNSFCDAYIDGVKSSLKSGYESLLTYDNFFLFKSSFTYNDNSYVFYKVVFAPDDIIYTLASDGHYISFSSENNPYLCGAVGFFGKKVSVSYHLQCIVNKSTYIDGGVSGGFMRSGAVFLDSSDVLVYASHDVYVCDELVRPVNPDGTISSDIKGNIDVTDDTYLLNYTAYTDADITKEFDITMFALDNASCPAKINDSLTYPFVNMERFLKAELVLTPSKKKVSGSFGLESAYYYLHQMKAYDDCLEAVHGYEFEAFEAKINIMYALAYREKGTSGDWIVLKYKLYDYTDIIDNVMGEFTVKKDYEDFPDINDYTEDFESWDDVAADCADENGEYNVIEVAVKWIGRNLLHFAHNFVGFFNWLFDCVPVLWDNLTIALYNLVCDLKALFVYLFNPKTKAIYELAIDRIPGLQDLQNAVSNNSTQELPSFTLFGTKFCLNLADYDIDFSYVRSISTVLVYIMFLFAVWGLITSMINHSNARQDGD